MEANIISIGTGSSKTYKEGYSSFQSAYKKDNFYNFIEVSDLGLSTDVQVDKRYHGGIDKAIHIGSIKHFTKFKDQYGKELDKLAIGSNILIDTFDEDDICVGDIYSIGDIRVEVTQPRQPCWKIGAIFGKDVNRYIIDNHAIGWYVRVLDEGILDINDEMLLEKRVSDITIKQLSYYVITPPKDQKLINDILSQAALSDRYKGNFKKALDK
ncbi:MAG: MOSC domain-containing protein [Campylobacterota bacterium]|nr:MOSC domain-containing protein [Campylobacterota bacterium]